MGRDCYLYARNKKRIQDIRVTPDLDAAYQNGSLAVNLDLKGSGKVDLELVDAQGKQVATATANKSGLVTMNVENPQKIVECRNTLFIYLACQHAGQQ